jgi:hypothetical protein
VGVRIPLPARIALKVTLTNQRLLNFLHALRLQVKARQTLLAGDGADPSITRGGTLALGSGRRRVMRRRFRRRCGISVRGGSSRRGVRRGARLRGYPPGGWVIWPLSGGYCLPRCRMGGRGVDRTRRGMHRRLLGAARRRAIPGVCTVRRQANSRQQTKRQLAGYVTGRIQTAPFITLRQTVSQE